MWYIVSIFYYYDVYNWLLLFFVLIYFIWFVSKINIEILLLNFVKLFYVYKIVLFLIWYKSCGV